MSKTDTMIQISKTTHKRLRDLKLFSRETFDHAINRILDKLKEVKHGR